MKRLDSPPRLDYWLDDDYDKVKPVESGWMFFDGDFINLHGSVEDVVSDPIPLKPRPQKRLQQRRVYEDPPEIKKPRPSYQLQATITNHYVRNPSQPIKEAGHSPGGVCQGDTQTATIQKEIRMNYSDRLAAGVLAIQKYQSTAGEVVQVEVGHDDDCGVFDGRACTCVPDIHIKAGDRTWRIDEEGSPILLTVN